MSDYNREKCLTYWEEKCTKFLVGKTIKSCRYLTEEEAADMDWGSSTLVIEFSDGSHLFASQDDEGNGPGALFTSDDDLSVIPII